MSELLASGNEDRRSCILVDDDDAARRSLQLLLHGRGYDVRSFGSAVSILGRTSFDDVDLLITDYRLPDMDGIGVLGTLRRAGWTGRAVMISGFLSPALIESAKAVGFDAVLGKPLRQNELIGALAP